MKRIVKLTGMLLMLILACNLSLNAQRGMRGTMDSARINRMKMSTDTIRRYSECKMMHPYGMRGMRPGSGFGQMERGGRFPDHLRNKSLRHDSFAAGRTGVRGSVKGGRGPGEYMLGSIPNVTEKQKKDIADLKLKQQAEMKKLREEMSSKMLSIRDSHKKSMMSILTDEQKKFIESKQPKANTAPEETK